VELYEIGNEPELACGYARDSSSAGERTAQLWIRLAPELRKHARAQGFSLVLGGPGFTTTHIGPNRENVTDLAVARAYLRAIKKTYEDPASPYFHDPDLIPSFLSFHAYASEFSANGGARPVDAVPRYGGYVDDLRVMIDDVWGRVIGPRIRIACTEWNYGAEGDLTNWSAADVSEFYTRFLAMLREHRVWLANQFLLASNGNAMDMITREGHTTPAYHAFKAASLSVTAESPGGP
jgi:hypothetical protein